MKKIPVIILAGFLGAGKTTLLNYILKNSLGMRIGVIVNDFGAVNVDALLVAQQTDKKVELSNGCICCTLGDGEMDETLDQLAHPGSKIDAIIIEASGIAEPGEIAFLIQASQNKYIEYAGITYVIDVKNFSDTQLQHPEMTEHIRMADLLVLNKVDSASREKQHEVVELCERLNPRAPLIKAAGSIDPKILFDIDEPVALQLSFAHTDTHEEHLHSQFSSVEFVNGAPLDPHHLQAFLKSPPKGVYRMKGVVYFGMKGYEQKFVLQFVGKRFTLYAEEWSDGEMPSSAIVCIGADMDELEVRAALEQCVDKSPDNLNEKTMLNLANYQRP